jgi:DNA primase
MNRPLSHSIFDLVRDGVGDATPELRAILSGRLEELASKIPDRALGWEYRKELRDRFREKYPPRLGRRSGAGVAKPPPRFQRPVIAIGQSADERGRILVAILLQHPNLLHDVEEAFGAVDLPPSLARLRNAILQWSETVPVLDSQALITHLTQIGLAADAAQALSAVPYPLPACAFPDAMPAEAEAGWWHIFGLMRRGRLEQEVNAAQDEMKMRGDEATQRRLIALCKELNALREDENGEAAEP